MYIRGLLHELFFIAMTLLGIIVIGSTKKLIVFISRLKQVHENINIKMGSIITITILYSTSVHLMSAITWTCIGVHFIFDSIYCTLCFPHVISVSVSCSSKGFLIFSLLFSYCFFKDVFLFSHNH